MRSRRDNHKKGREGKEGRGARKRAMKWNWGLGKERIAIKKKRQEQGESSRQKDTRA